MNNDERILTIPVDQIKPNPYQPRKTFDAARIDDLAASIAQHGILQPIVLSEHINGYYIVVGERRYRASKTAGLTEIPAIVKQLSDEDMMELAIIENLQREDLNPIEEAESYRRLMEELNLTQQDVARRLGKSRPYIANMLRLIQLPPVIKKAIQSGYLSGAHGRTLLGLKDATAMKKIAKTAMKEQWSVRDLERYVQQLQPNVKEKEDVRTSKGTKPAFIRQHEKQLREKYGTTVTIDTKKGTGHITFAFTSEADYKALMQQLKHE